MKCFEFDLTSILKVTHLGKEHLILPRLHCTRCLSEYIVYIICSGELCIENNGIPQILRKGDIFIFSEGDFQKPLKASDCEYYYIHFKTSNCRIADSTEEEYVKTYIKKRVDCLKKNLYSTEMYDYFKIMLFQKCHIDDNGLFSYIENLAENNKISPKNNSPENRFNVSHAVADILMTLEKYNIDVIEKSTSKKSDTSYLYAKKIASFVDKNYKQNFSASDLEKEFFISFDYANRLFRNNIGMSIMKYRTLLRINNAKNALKITNKTVTEIAKEAGFSDAAYFARAFKKSEGLSPGAYRRRAWTDETLQEK